MDKNKLEVRSVIPHHHTGKSYDYYNVIDGNGLEEIHKDLIESEWKE